MLTKLLSFPSVVVDGLEFRSAVLKMIPAPGDRALGRALCRELAVPTTPGNARGSNLA